MTPPPSVVSSSFEADSLSPRSPSRRGQRLVVARVVWLILAVGLLVNFIASLPAYYAQLLTLCTNTASGRCGTFQLTVAALPALQQLGLSLNTYAALCFGVDVVVSLVYLLVGAVIFWRKSSEWSGLFFSFVLVLFGSFGVSDTLVLEFVPKPANPPVPFLLAQLLIVCLQWGLLGAFLLTFPTGRFAPGWTWVLVVSWWVQAVLFLTSAIAIAASVRAALVFLLTWGSVAAVQFYRYRRLYTPMQRQQTKWVIFGYLMGVVVNVVSLGLGAVVPGLGTPASPYQLLVEVISVVPTLLIPLSIGIAILRYRLWDIDTIINQTLVYGTLTGLLGVLYAGLILGLESLMEVITRQTYQPVVLVISTLVIFVLFLPVRRRIQTIIDRRFYRRKYDAESILTSFSAILLHEVDLVELSQRLVDVVQETMQPASVSLWLRASGKMPLDERTGARD
jgi:hypothetical protein